MRKFVVALALVIALAERGTAGEETAPLLKTFVDELVTIEPGQKKFPAEFVPGEEPEGRRVPVTGPFRIARYEVPQNLYEAVMGTNPSRWKGPRNSVEMTSAEDADTFCDKLTPLLRDAQLIGPDEEVRLPTEREWEYCCRAGTATPYSFGDSAVKEGDTGNQASILDEYGWHTGNAAGNDPPVGAKRPNPWGLYDVHGYLWEFATIDDEPNKIALRGGSWKDRHPDLRSSSRKVAARTLKDDAVGFRCVLAKRAEAKK